MHTLNRSAIVVKPKQPFLDWLHAADPTSQELRSSTWLRNQRSILFQSAARIKS